MDQTTENVLPNTGSLVEFTSSLRYDVKGDERHITVLHRKIEELSAKVHELETKKILEETQLPPEILANSGLLPPKPQRWKRGKGYRPPTISEIKEATKVSPFTTRQAAFLGMHQVTFKKYAKMYGYYDPHPCALGKKQPHDPELGKYPLSKILAGEMNDNVMVTDFMVCKKLYKAKTFPEQCDACGYNKKLITDGKVPLLLDHLDGNRRNFKKENIRLLCWNCTVECGRGYLRRRIHMFDPDLFKE